MSDVYDGLSRKIVSCCREHKAYELSANDGKDCVTACELVSDKMIARLGSCPDGLRQDLMVTSCWINKYDMDGKVAGCPALKDIDMSVATAFSKRPVRELPAIRAQHMSAVEKLISASNRKDRSVRDKDPTPEK